MCEGSLACSLSLKSGHRLSLPLRPPGAEGAGAVCVVCVCVWRSQRERLGRSVGRSVGSDRIAEGVEEETRKGNPDSYARDGSKRRKDDDDDDDDDDDACDPFVVCGWCLNRGIITPGRKTHTLLLVLVLVHRIVYSTT